jgi:hypothetical protein
MKIVLIGASGYVGSALLKEARARGHEVTARVGRHYALQPRQAPAGETPREVRELRRTRQRAHPRRERAAWRRRSDVPNQGCSERPAERSLRKPRDLAEGRGRSRRGGNRTGGTAGSAAQEPFTIGRGRNVSRLLDAFAMSSRRPTAPCCCWAMATTANCCACRRPRSRRGNVESPDCLHAHELFGMNLPRTTARRSNDT